jgi:hypothetical protein
MRKNYHQVRKQRELAKKVRQQEKQQRRTARLGAAASPTVEAPESDPVAASDALVRGTS